MTEATLIFPHQLYDIHPAIAESRPIFLIEDPLFFGDKEFPVHFHKQKLLLHRASMKAYEQKLKADALHVEYIEYNDKNTYFTIFTNQQSTTLHIVDPTDYILRKRLERFAQEHKITITWYDNPNFLTSTRECKHLLEGKNPYRFTSFYTAQRKRLKILVNSEGKPFGGRWSYDPLNRKKLPKKTFVPPYRFEPENETVEEARKYVQINFQNNPGVLDDFIFPVTHADARVWLNRFLEERFDMFGPYEDAISKDHVLLFHSGLSALMNIGLLQPNEVVRATLLYFKAHRDVPIESLEGFIRQIIGWREYIRAIYELSGVQQRHSNKWQHSRKIPQSFWTGETGIEPIDHTIKKLLNHAYTHHIERLMILGNFMMLCEFDPDEIYRWFMTFHIDAYDWVMVPNVYGMSQHADGGMMMTKPYISSSSYILRMSDYKKGAWCEVWDALYWRFINKHREFFASNPRLSMMVNVLDKMDDEKKKKMFENAENYLQALENNS